MRCACLSHKTGEATKEIASEVSQIRSSSSDVEKRMRQIANESQKLAQIGGTLVDGMNSIIGLSRQMEQAVSSGSLRSFVEVAKIDHLVFKVQVYMVLMGQLEKPARGVLQSYGLPSGALVLPGRGGQLLLQVGWLQGDRETSHFGA